MINFETKGHALPGGKVACQDCSIYQLCLPTGIDQESVEALNRIIKRTRPLKRGDHLFSMGAPFQSIYAVRSGSIKTYVPTDDGFEQVTGFYLPGELIGLDAITSEIHPCSAKVLESTSVCEIPFRQLEELADSIPALRQQMMRILSRELLHERLLFMLLGKKSAEERLAGLLISLSRRFQHRGFSASDFHLSMSRNDIANYLGLAVETVSRLFSRFQNENLLRVERKHIRIIDQDRLAVLANNAKLPEETKAFG